MSILQLSINFNHSCCPLVLTGHGLTWVLSWLSLSHHPTVVISWETCTSEVDLTLKSSNLEPWFPLLWVISKAVKRHIYWPLCLVSCLCVCTVTGGSLSVVLCPHEDLVLDKQESQNSDTKYLTPYTCIITLLQQCTEGPSKLTSWFVLISKIQNPPITAYLESSLSDLFLLCYSTLLQSLKHTHCALWSDVSNISNTLSLFSENVTEIWFSIYSPLILLKI